MMNKILCSTLLVLVFLTCGQSAVLGGALFEDPLDSGAAWSLVHQADASDNFTTFGFDYSALGIPEAPNTTSGAATSGLQMIVNRDFGEVNGTGAFPTGMNFTGSYTLQFDMWLNAAGVFPDGGTGSTEFGGAFVGFDNSAGTPYSGAGSITSGEGGSTNDWRLYAASATIPDERQEFDTHLMPEEAFASDYNGDFKVDARDYTLWRDTLGDTVPVDGLFADGDFSGTIDIGDYILWKNEFGGEQVNDLFSPEMNTDNADGNDYVEGIFPGLEPPLAQQNAEPDQSGTTKDGTLAFRWVTYKFSVDTVAGTALVQVTDADTGVTANVGTFTLENTYVDRDTIATKIITSLEGNIALVYRDPFASIIDEHLLDYSFGLFDNVIVEQTTGSLAGGNVPEPATWMLLVGGASCLWIARRRSR
ncbi:MAG: PEP-CTERM sorting domain-containing protein [Aeoliella sp.]